MTTVDAAWRGLDDETRLDVVSVDLADEGGLVATGRQSTETYRVQWDLVVDSRWQTKFVTLDAEGYADVSRETSELGADLEPSARREPVWQRHLNLWRREERRGSRWRWEGDESGDVPTTFRPLGFADDLAELFAEAVDIDLSGCPLTNTMPIRRLGVEAAGVSDRPITTAWISLPELAVMPSRQVYSSAPPGLAELMAALDERLFSVVHYRSATRHVSVDLSVDQHGIVLTYPDLASRIDLE